MRRSRAGRALVSTLAALLLAGCGAGGESGGVSGGAAASKAEAKSAGPKSAGPKSAGPKTPREPPKPARPRQGPGGWSPGADPPPAVPRKVIGGLGESSAGCELPARFMMTAKWNPRPTDPPAGERPRDGRTPEPSEPAPRPARERAGLTLQCEIVGPSKAKVMRVWTGESPASGTDVRSMLERFVAAGHHEKDRVGPSTYTKLVASGATGWQVAYRRINSNGEPRRESAFALPAGDGVLLISTKPVSPETYDEVRPVFVLAKTTITVTR